jgi:hypothetical protein
VRSAVDLRWTAARGALAAQLAALVEAAAGAITVRSGDPEPNDALIVEQHSAAA